MRVDLEEDLRGMVSLCLEVAVFHAVAVEVADEEVHQVEVGQHEALIEMKGKAVTPGKSMHSMNISTL